MSRFDQASIAATILNAPGWARVGITAPNDWLRDDAANELARAILADLGEGEGGQDDPGQLNLSL